MSKLGTLIQADPALAVVSSGPGLHLDNRNFQSPDFRNWTNSLETGQKISTLLTLLRRLPSSPSSLRKDDEEDQRLRTSEEVSPQETTDHHEPTTDHCRREATSRFQHISHLAMTKVCKTKLRNPIQPGARLVLCQEVQG